MLSEEENIISPSDEVRIVNAFKYWYETNTEKGVTSIPDYICKGLLDLYKKEKEKNKELENTLKQTQDSWYKDTQTIQEFKRLKMEKFEDDYISKDKIKELLHSYSVDDKRFMKYLKELLEE